MEFKGEHLIDAPIESVWRAINDPRVLKACIPGCQSLSRNEDGSLESVVQATIGPISTRFHGILRMEGSFPPHSVTLVGEGSGGAAGFAKGRADVTLKEEDGKTRLSYSAQAQIGGRLAQIGSRLIAGVINQLSGRFFTQFSEYFSAPPPTPVVPTAGELPLAEPLIAASPMVGDLIPVPPMPAPAPPPGAAGSQTPESPAPTPSGAAPAAAPPQAPTPAPPSPASPQKTPQRRPRRGRLILVTTIAAAAAVLLWMLMRAQ